jgi:ribonuclease HII
LKDGTRLLAGVDEVGRGSIAGPVIAAVVVLGSDTVIEGLADSKTLSPEQRTQIASVIATKALAWSIGRAEVSEIDRINILQASLLAMQRAIATLSIQPDWVLVDGNRYPQIPYQGEARIGGDAAVPEISAASVIAKVTRDQEMRLLDRLYPGYHFAIHKGYPTKMHHRELFRLGVSQVHRRSFAPVKNMAGTAWYLPREAKSRLPRPSGWAGGD